MRLGEEKKKKERTGQKYNNASATRAAIKITVIIMIFPIRLRILMFDVYLQFM